MRRTAAPRRYEQRSRPEFVAYWRVPRLGGVEFFKAEFRTHLYARHSHETYAIGVTERGAQVFRCRGEQHASGAGSAVVINPDDVHDGRALSSDGYRYRMIYVDARLFSAAVGEFTGQSGTLPLFANPVIADTETASLIADFHASAEHPDGILALETCLVRLLARLATRHATRPIGQRRDATHNALVAAVHHYLERHLDGDPSLSDLARVTGISRYHLLRLFHRYVGMPPHAYLTLLRLRAARRLLAQGEGAASVAAAVGFVDQSHLTKRFRAAYGITPAQFSAALS